MFRTYLARISKEFGNGYECRITLSQPNGVKHHVYRGKLNKDTARILKSYNMVRVIFHKHKWYIDTVIPLKGNIQRLLIQEHANLIPYPSK